MTDNLPAWFRKTPMFTAHLAKQRSDDEARRRTIAAQRDALIAAERRDAPKRQKQMDAAHAKLQAAEAALVEARATHTKTLAPLLAESVAHSQTLDRLTADLRRLASPHIDRALIAVADRIDAVRRGTGPTVARDLDALRAVRPLLTDLYERVDVDATAEVAKLLASVDLPTTE